ncbi:MAG TPA: carboxypeptidase-like regulatory domain-containing protein [Solirubrobacteraceae bacterium]|nr:carboxypeptidase-like regulatory domain-containing protein [Solirubrobacteraceae bacterium]
MAMQSQPTPVACRAALRARVAACLRAQRGDTLIEVLVAALLVALIAAASLTGFGAVGGAVGNQRNEEQAATLAQQDQARLRGLNITQLSGSLGNQTAPPVTIDGTAYTVTSKSQFVSGAGGAASCTTSGTASADEVATTSTVTWSPSNDGRPPVILHGIITPAQGGSLIISATDQNGDGLAGVTATVTGPSTVAPLTTDSSGCAVFAGLTGGTYTVSYSDPGYVDKNGNPPASWTGPVTSTQTTAATPLQLAQDGAISATFTTTFNGSTQPATSDTFVASNGNAGITPRIFGTASTPRTTAYSSTIVSPTTVFPFSSAYSAYAGTCGPNSWATTPGPPAVTVNPGATSSVVIPEPAMIVLPWTSGSATAYNDNSGALNYSSGWTHASGQSWTSGDYNNDETYSNTAGNTMTVTFTGTSVQWLAPYAGNHGYAKVYLDGTLVSTVDTYASPTTFRNVAYSASGLTNTSHTLRIVVKGTHDGSSSGTYVSIDEIIVGGATPALMTTMPNVTVTDTDSGCGNETYPPTQIPTPTQGALANPGEPYGNFTVCVDNGSFHNTATVTNTNFAAGNVVNVYLYNGAPGYASGTCP